MYNKIFSKKFWREALGIDEIKINKNGNLFDLAQKYKNKLKDGFILGVKKFHSKEWNLDILEEFLKLLNPNDEGSNEYEWYNDWIRDSIQGYKNGDEYLLSLTSSGSIIQGADENDEYSEEEEYDDELDEIKLVKQSSLDSVDENDPVAIGKYFLENLDYIADILGSEKKGFIEEMADNWIHGSFQDFAKSALQNLKNKLKLKELKTVSDKQLNDPPKPNIPEPYEQSPEDRKQIIKDFIKFAYKKLKLKTLPGITLSKDREEARNQKTMGYFNPETTKIWVYVGNRNLADILRTLAHELVHRKQEEDGRLQSTSGETGSEIENEANAQAGILLREFGKINNMIYESKQVDEIKLVKNKLSAQKVYTEDSIDGADYITFKIGNKDFYGYPANGNMDTTNRFIFLIDGDDQFRVEILINYFNQHKIPYETNIDSKKSHQDDYIISVNTEYFIFKDDKLEEIKLAKLGKNGGKFVTYNPQADIYYINGVGFQRSNKDKDGKAVLTAIGGMNYFNKTTKWLDENGFSYETPFEVDGIQLPVLTVDPQFIKEEDYGFLEEIKITNANLFPNAKWNESALEIYTTLKPYFKDIQTGLAQHAKEKYNKELVRVFITLPSGKEMILGQSDEGLFFLVPDATNLFSFKSFDSISELCGYTIKNYVDKNLEEIKLIKNSIPAKLIKTVTDSDFPGMSFKRIGIGMDGDEVTGEQNNEGGYYFHFWGKDQYLKKMGRFTELLKEKNIPHKMGVNWVEVPEEYFNII